MLATLERNRVETERPTYVQPSYLAGSTIEDDEYSTNYSSNGFGSYNTTQNYSSYGNTMTDTEPAFEIETEYNQAEKRQEFKTVTSSMQSVERSQVVSQPKASTKLSPRLKIIMSVFSIVMVMLVAFVIYNAVAINTAANIISAKQVEVAASAEVINGLSVQYNELGTDSTIRSNISSEFIEPDSTNTVLVNRPKIAPVEVYEAPTNWFDQICQFFSGLF